MIFALITTTKFVSAADLYRMAKPLELNAQHVAKAYMLYHAPAVVPIDDERKLPPGCFPVVFVDEGGGAGTLAEHWFDPQRDIPAARVFVHRTPALNSGPYSTTEAASHEIGEATINPMLDGWRPHPSPHRAGVEIANEPNDPAQDHYVIRVDGTDWQVSNFVTPFWYSPEFIDRPSAVKYLEEREGFGLDWCKRIKTPGEIGPEGYAVMRRRKANGRGWERWSEDSLGPLAAGSTKLTRQKRHPASRTSRLGGVR